MSRDASTSAKAAGFTSGYAARDVARLLGMTVPQIVGCVRAGCLSPRRGPRREYRFSFQDLVLLRTAKALMARMNPRRVHQALLRLRDQLPEGRQLTAVRLTAEGEDVVVRDGGSAWNPVSGQLVLELDVAGLASAAAPLARQAVEAARQSPEVTAEEWFHLGCDLEPCDEAQAIDAYRRTIELEPSHADAHLNLGRMLHESGRIEEAQEHYRKALEARAGDSTAAFNLGVALEDLRRPHAAAAAYEQALSYDASCADAHYNLARLWERLGEPRKALRHLQAYRSLAGSGEGPSPE